jgi:hypothetical protein
MKKESIEEVAEKLSVGIKEENYKDGIIDGYNYSQQQINCELSELKSQRDEMLAMLEELELIMDKDLNPTEMHSKIQQLIKKVKNE